MGPTRSTGIEGFFLFPLYKTLLFLYTHLNCFRTIQEKVLLTSLILAGRDL